MRTPAPEAAPDQKSDSVFPVPYEQGQVLAGKYRVNRLLGKGGMGYVLEAEHLHLGRRVAIKLLRPEHAKRKEWVTRFMREARTASTLPSDHVVQILDVELLDDATPYMVMEYLEGVDLARLIDQQGPVEPDEAVGFVLQACRALAEAHERGIVHRDLKPGNLFLTRRADGTAVIKVFDFGISKVTQSLWSSQEAANITSTQATMGSPHYMSPEQLRSTRSVDRRSDIWSLGVILHELMSGATPFAGESLSGVCAAVVADPPIPLRDHVPQAPAELETLILQCLEKSPDRRPQTVEELAERLRPFASEPASFPAPASGLHVDREHPSTARTLEAVAQPSSLEAPTDRSLEGLLTGDPEEALPPEYRPEPRPPDPEAERLEHSPTQPMPPPRPQPPRHRTPASFDDQDDEEDGSSSLVWAGVALGAVVVLGGLGYAGYSVLASRVETPTAQASPSATDPTITPVPLVASTARTDDTTVTLLLQVTPEDALVVIDGEVVEKRTLRMPKSDVPRKLVVSAPGYVTSVNEFTPTVGGALVVTLKPQGGKER